MPESESWAIATKQYKADPSHKSKSSSVDLALWKGFGDEMYKIVEAALKPSTLKMQPKMTARPIVKDPDPPGSVIDQISSSRTVSPPPVTSGVY